MSITLDTLTVKRRATKASLTLGEGEEKRTEEVRISFNTVTPKLFDELTAVADQKSVDQPTAVRQLVMLEIKSDEILDGEGNPAQLSEELLGQFSASNVSAILSAIMDEISPNVTSLPPTNSTS